MGARTDDGLIGTMTAARWLGVSFRRLDYLSRRGAPGVPPSNGSGAPRAWLDGTLRKLYVATSLYRQLGELAPEWSTLARRLLEGPEPPPTTYAAYVWVGPRVGEIKYWAWVDDLLAPDTGLCGFVTIPDLPT